MSSRGWVNIIISSHSVWLCSRYFKWQCLSAIYYCLFEGKKEDSMKEGKGKRKLAHDAIFFLSPQESHKRVSGFSAGWILLPSAQGIPAESMAHRPGRTCSRKLYSLNHSEMPGCFMSVKLRHNLLPLFLNVIKGFHNAPHSVSAVSTTVFCILDHRMDSANVHKANKQTKPPFILWPFSFSTT